MTAGMHDTPDDDLRLSLLTLSMLGWPKKQRGLSAPCHTQITLLRTHTTKNLEFTQAMVK